LLTKSQKNLLRGHFLFEGLEASEQEKLFEQLEVTGFANGEPIFTPTHFTKALGILLRGEAVVMKGQAQLNRLAAGDTFGSAALFTDEGTELRYATTLVAHKSVQVVFINEERLQEWMLRCPPMALSYIRFLSGRVRFLNGRIDSFTTQGTREALLKFLKSQVAAAKSGADATAVKSLQLQESYAELARKLSISRASLYRGLDELEAEGVIHREGKTIFVLKDIQEES